MIKNLAIILTILWGFSFFLFFFYFFAALFARVQDKQFEIVCRKIYYHLKSSLVFAFFAGLFWGFHYFWS